MAEFISCVTAVNSWWRGVKGSNPDWGGLKHTDILLLNVHQLWAFASLLIVLAFAKKSTTGRTEKGDRMAFWTISS